MPVPHVLERTIVEIDAPDADLARHAQAAIAGRLSACLEACLDACAGKLAEGMMLRLDRVAVDLGTIPPARLDDLFAAQLAARLAAALDDAHDRVERLPGPERERALLPVTGDRIDVLVHYLATGTLPWYACGQADFDLDREIGVLLVEAQPPLVARLAECMDLRSAERIALQLRPQTLLQLLAALAGTHCQALADVRRAWRDMTAALPMLVDPAARARAQTAVDAAMVAAAAARADADQAAAYVGEALGTQLRDWRAAAALTVDYLEAVRALPPVSPVRRWIERRAAAGLADDAIGRYRTLDPSAAPAAPDRGLAAAQIQAAQTAAARTGKAAHPRAAHAARLKNDLGIADDIARKSAVVATDAPAAGPRLAPANAAIDVGNAGLVLLWPLLRDLFDRVGLLADRRFATTDAALRAVLLTQYVIDGGDDWPEHLLALNKLLCGVALDAPVPRRFAPTTDEVREASELLAAVLAHWTAVGATSRDGLRTAFLQRAGRLTALDAGWKLTVERAGYDVLLDRLPWGIGVVRLPWMRAPVYVEW